MGGSYSVSADEIIENLTAAYEGNKDMKAAIAKAKDDIRSLEKNEDKERVEERIRQYENMIVEPTIQQAEVIPTIPKKDRYSFTLKMVNQETRMEENVTFDIPREAVENQPAESKKYLPVIENCLQDGRMCSMFDEGKLFVCVDVYGDDLKVNYCTDSDQEFKANILVRSKIPEDFLKTLFFKRYYAITVENVIINRNKKGSVTFYVHSSEYDESKVTAVEDVNDLIRLVKAGEIVDDQTAVKNMLRVWGEYIIFNIMLIVNGIIAVVIIKKFISRNGYMFADVEIKKAVQIFDNLDENSVDIDKFINKMVDFLQQLIDQFESSDSCIDTDAIVQQFEEARVFEALDDDRKDAVYDQLEVCFRELCNMNGNFFGSSKLEVREALEREIIPEILQNLRNRSDNTAVQQEGSFTKVVSPLANEIVGNYEYPEIENYEQEIEA